MKKFFKVIGIVLALIFAGSVIAALVGGNDQTSTPDNKQKVEKKATETVVEEPSKPVETPPVVEAPPEKQKPGQVEYDKIKIGDTLTGEGGMSIKDVKNLLGDPEVNSESQSGDYKITMMMWDAKGGLGANISVSFTNGKASSKSQSGIK